MFDEFEGEDKPIKSIQSILTDKLYETVDRYELYDSIFDGCKILVRDNLDTYICKDITFEVLNGYFVNIQISVDVDDMNEMLEKVMNFYIEEELYEKCAEVKKFQDELE